MESSCQKTHTVIYQSGKTTLQIKNRSYEKNFQKGLCKNTGRCPDEHYRTVMQTGIERSFLFHCYHYYFFFAGILINRAGRKTISSACIHEKLYHDCGCNISNHTCPCIDFIFYERKIQA